MTVVIVGASLAGIRTAQALRRQGYDGELVIVGDEPHPPYDRPPLSKDMLTGEGEAVPLLSRAELEALDADLRLGIRATGLDTRRRVVRTEAGEIAFTDLVIATGVVPRGLPGMDGLAGVHTLRTLDDAYALREELRHARRAVVVGAGFIGAEFASSATGRGLGVSVVEVQDTPMGHLFGDEVGARLAKLHELNGVRVHTRARVACFTGDGRVEAVLLDDGRSLPADVVVVGIGAEPATGWLAGSGLPVDDGVHCDENLRVLGHPGIHAAGDVARWRHPLYPEPLRIEHWTNAGGHASVVAADILGTPPPRAQVPYVWSDQYGRRIQIVGRPALGKPARMAGDIETGPFAALYADEDGTVVGALVVDDPRLLMKCRKAISNRDRADGPALGFGSPVPDRR